MTLITIVRSLALAAAVTVPILSLWLCRNRRREILLALASLATCLSLSELVLRGVYPQVMEHNELFESDSGLGWRFVPNKKAMIVYEGEARHSVETNASGFRDAPFIGDTDRATNIMVLGDSFLTNLAVRASDVFTEVMERRMVDTSVMNFGVNGYGQVQEYLLLEQWFERAQPDLLILLIYVRNDFEDNIGQYPWLYNRPSVSWNEGHSTLTIVPPAAHQPRRPTLPFWRSYRQLHLYQLMNQGLETVVSRWVRASTGPSRHLPPELYLCRTDPSDEVLHLYRIMQALLLKFASFAEDHTVPIVFAIAPSIVQVNHELWASTQRAHGLRPKDYKRSLPGDALVEFAATNNLLLLDLLPPLLAAAEEGGPLYNRREEHWTARGNLVVARVVSEFLEREHLTDPIGD